MPFLFLKPDWVVLDVLRLPLDALEAQGIKGFIFDLDNTIMPPHTAQLSEAMRDWLTSLTARGFGYIVVSNNHNIAYMKQAEDHIGVPVLGPAKKPRRAILQAALTQLELPANQVCVVGDRPPHRYLGRATPWGNHHPRRPTPTCQRKRTHPCFTSIGTPVYPSTTPRTLYWLHHTY